MLFRQINIWQHKDHTYQLRSEEKTTPLSSTAVTPCREQTSHCTFDSSSFVDHVLICRSLIVRYLTFGGWLSHWQSYHISYFVYCTLHFLWCTLNFDSLGEVSPITWCFLCKFLWITVLYIHLKHCSQVLPFFKNILKELKDISLKRKPSIITSQTKKKISQY